MNGMNDFSPTTYALLKKLIGDTDAKLSGEISEIIAAITTINTSIEELGNRIVAYHNRPKTINRYTFTRPCSGMLIYPSQIGNNTESMNCLIGFYRVPTNLSSIFFNRSTFGSAELSDFEVDGVGFKITNSASSGTRHCLFIALDGLLPTQTSEPIPEPEPES
ncbi:MAG: hypothetical protein J6S67_01560 [Methanobrevibacter sp.]|nr:hypothetical protein [Methanobrevibacter sp.]